MPASLVAGVLAVAVLTVAGCSSSGGTPAASSAASVASAVKGAAATAGATSAADPAHTSADSSGGTSDPAKLCADIPTADVQKLSKSMVGPAMAASGGDCQWLGGEIDVTIRPDDSSKQRYKDLDSVGTPTPTSGVGDEAQWIAVDGSPPDFVAHKGSTTLTLEVSLTIPDTTLTYTGSDPFFKVTPADNLTYVGLEGAVCDDIFKAAGS